MFPSGRPSIFTDFEFCVFDLFTFTEMLSDNEPALAVTVAVPSLTPVTMPLLSTVRTDVSDDDQFTFCVHCAGFTIAEREIVSPASTTVYLSSSTLFSVIFTSDAPALPAEKAAVTAASASTTPYARFISNTPRPFSDAAVAQRMFFTCSGVSDGSASRTSAATEEAIGVAMLVPYMSP